MQAHGSAARSCENGHSAVLTSEHRSHVPAPHGRDATATCSTEAAAARIFTHVSGQHGVARAAA
eukprot:2308644-Prymnesium_polylepis.1